MSGFGYNTEYNTLTSVLLHKPGIEIHMNVCPEKILHSGTINAKKLSDEFENIIKIYRDHKIQVNLIDPTPMSEDMDYIWNMMYSRDLLFMTPEGAILSNMFPAIRRGEVKYARRSLEKLCIPVLHKISGDATFEGADAIWIDKKHAIIGVGARTNKKGFEQIKKILNKMNIVCDALPNNQTKTQHLLGTLQIIDEKKALLRHEINNNALHEFLRSYKFSVINIPENEEVRQKQAMNIVTIAPNKIIMTAGCHETRSIYENAGVEVIAEIEIEELIKGTGGLACATGILSRSFE